MLSSVGVKYETNIKNCMPRTTGCEIVKLAALTMGPISQISIGIQNLPNPTMIGEPVFVKANFFRTVFFAAVAV
jgi:hypothetical protein